MKRALLAALLSLALVRPLRAQESADETKKAAVLEEARQHVARAKVHYDLGEFKEAADEYILVYRLRPIAALLFNIAQAYRQGGLYDKARQFYKSYLREAPEAKNRATIEQAIREMDELLAKEKRTKEAPPAGVKEPAEAALPLSAKGHPDKPAPQSAPATVVEAPKPAEPAKASALTKPGEASAPKPEVVASGKPAPNPELIATAKPAPTQSAAAKPAPSAPPASSTPPAAKPPASAMATTRPNAPPAATPSTQAPHPQPVVEESEGGILTKWWFWTAVGVVAIGAGTAAVTLGGNSPPGSHFSGGI
jgi:tetratricopeptide (TPR) repeat protein